MSDIQRQGIITLVRNAILGEKKSVPEGFNLSDAIIVAQKHQITNMLYYGALQAQIAEDISLKQLFALACVALSKSEQQLLEIENIFTVFNKQGIEYMTLKGVDFKFIYPRPDMRYMVDADILIKPSQYHTIKDILIKMGFKEKAESDHEFIWYMPSLVLELHKRLIPSYNSDFYQYFGDGWRLAQPSLEQPNRYKMSPEDTFIYLFTHFSKHYRDAGIGIRHMTDIWIYRQKNSDLNEDYLANEFKKLHLWDFYKNVNATLEVWFGEGKPTNITDFITNVIFNSGSYGTHKAHIASEAVRFKKISGTIKGVRKRKIIKVLFPAKANMINRYPILKIAPILLPLFWIVRGIETLIFSFDKVKRQRENMKLLSDENITDFQKALEFVGLDFNFKG